MKQIQFVLFLIAFSFYTKVNAQADLKDYSKLVLNTYVPEQLDGIIADLS